MGEPTQRDPAEQRAAPGIGTERRNDGRDMSSPTISTKLERIAKLAREKPDVPLTTLAHHIDVDWLREAYRLTRKDGVWVPEILRIVFRKLCGLQ